MTLVLLYGNPVSQLQKKPAVPICRVNTDIKNNFETTCTSSITSLNSSAAVSFLPTIIDACVMQEIMKKFLIKTT